MSTFFIVVIIICAVLGLGMVKERLREKMIRAWVARHGGTFHWPFVEAQHPDLPAKQLTCRFETQGAHQWAAGIEHEVNGKPIWLIEYSATPSGQSTSRWHCLFAEACANEAEAKRLCHERNESSHIAWAACGHWIAKRDIGLTSSAQLDELTAHLR